MATALKLTSGELTAYGYQCGYIDQYNACNTHLTMGHDSGCYWVKAFNYVTRTRLFWHHYPTLTPARKLYRKAKKRLERNEPIRVDGSWHENA